MSKNIPNDIISKFNERINQRVASTRSGRFDLRLSDYEVLDDRDATILVTYENNMGFPKRSQLDEWVTSSFNGQMILDIESTRIHSDVNAVVAMVHKNEIKRPVVLLASVAKARLDFVSFPKPFKANLTHVRRRSSAAE